MIILDFLDGFFTYTTSLLYESIDYIVLKKLGYKYELNIKIENK